jgi:hypothetical protein
MANGVNARFREWINGGWVTITLVPGRERNWHRGQRTDEGWDITEYSWLLEGGTIHRSIVSDGTDCDGRLTHWHMSMARIEDIARPERDPVWLSCEETQRDHAAEAAGY